MWACTPPDETTTTTSSDTSAETGTSGPPTHSAVTTTGGTGGPGHSATTPTGDTGGATTPTGTTADTGGPVPCLAPPPTAIASQRLLSRVPRSEEFAFDTAGNVLTPMESAGIYRTTYNGNPVLFSPYNSWELAGARVTPDGLSLAVCDEAAGRIVSIDLQNGAQTVMASGLPSPNSIGFDQRGWLYVASYGQVTRYRGIGQPVEVLMSRPGNDFDGVAFAPDDAAVYVNVDDLGEIWAIELDAAGAVTNVVNGVTLPLSWGVSLDGMTTDVCGNLYIVSTNGELRRIRTDHTIETLIRGNGRSTSAVSFGSGFGGFERDHLYMMDRNAGLLDLDLGIEGHREPHYPP